MPITRRSHRSKAATRDDKPALRPRRPQPLAQGRQDEEHRGRGHVPEVRQHAAGGGDLILNNQSTSTLTVSSVIANNGGTVNLVKVGAGTQTLGGIAAHAGGIALEGGALVLSAINTFGGGVTVAGGMLATRSATKA